MTVRLIDGLVTTEPLADVFSDEAILAAMLRFEVALARAESRAGVIPESVARAVSQAADAGSFDPADLARRARTTGTLVIPFVDVLRERVRAIDADAATFVHWGATSQDVSDTALVLCLSNARLILTVDHERLLAALRRLSEAHAGTIMLGRTLLQPAGPITFGLKAAGWFGAIEWSGTRLWEAFDETRVLQFGGATGTLAALGDQGLRVAAELEQELDLAVPDAPWHAQRERLAAFVCACGVYAGALGKIARDVSLLMQFEVGEAAEQGGGSSAMPHKRNPAGCAVALACAIRVPALVAAFLTGMMQEHERGVGGWHAEWSAVAAVVQTTGSALLAIASAMDAIEVDPQRMRDNLAATRGSVFAERAMILLSRTLGRDAAQRIVASALETAAHEHRPFGDVLSADPAAIAALAPEELSTSTTPEAYLGSAEAFRRRLLGHPDE